LQASTVRILVVDDYEPFRQFVRSMLGKRQDLQIVGEASDGLQAVLKAEELKPDLMVLDIGLPSLNGFEVARRIRKLRPECKIIFMSQGSSTDLAQEAFSSGAVGYVVKAHAASELLAAVEAVRQGRQFLSKGLLSRSWTSSTDAQASGHNHEVTFYSDEAAFLVGLTCFIEAALSAGRPVIVVATESHRKSLLQGLLARGVDAAAAMKQGLYLSLDVDETLSTFMVNDRPDSVRFLTLFSDLLSSTTKAAKGKRVAACGEFAPTLWRQGKTDAAIQIEHLTDEIAKTCDVDILCGYVLNGFQREQESHIHGRICTEHSAVRPQ
jgi:DNA-binding NarL/FixJ family response regulator